MFFLPLWKSFYEKSLGEAKLPPTHPSGSAV
jgi:hypothetical protein